jgi:transcriptional regulator with XRE-family HTH domain
MSSEKSFGARLKALRRALGVSQEELASRCQRSVEAISNIERGLNFPSFDLLIGIASALGIGVGLLFDEESTDARAILLAKADANLRSLGDEDLDVATRQIEALATRKPRAES